MSKNEARLGRVNEELMKALSQIITYELKNPDVTGMISVTRVKVTPDLKYAKVYVSMLNSKSVEKTIAMVFAFFISSKILSKVIIVPSYIDF